MPLQPLWVFACPDYVCPLFCQTNDLQVFIPTHTHTLRHICVHLVGARVERGVCKPEVLGFSAQIAQVWACCGRAGRIIVLEGFSSWVAHDWSWCGLHGCIRYGVLFYQLEPSVLLPPSTAATNGSRYSHLYSLFLSKGFLQNALIAGLSSCFVMLDSSTPLLNFIVQ